MGLEDPFNFADNANRIFNGTEILDFAEAWMEFSQITEVAQRNIITLFLTDCYNYIKGVIHRDD